MIVRDAGLRSALVVRLSESFDLLTAARWDAGLAARALVRAPAVLVIDEQALVEDAFSWVELLAGDHGFARIVVITADAPANPEPQLVMQVDRETAMAGLPQIFSDLTALS
ncbi:hypothetical protein P1X14_15030 [Sphingomonas sp. AOB5]|uniref:hypothetical protein n=1 Tax=Sphingomonas sp. AOB5 TaxID=3034017 RepID=UPI0023F8D7D9|nr:hypothetical protein [Sphingomonas sp. AOB5]MDF7776568.1 hypothetical protein [Sphingomonas sp. AOB5]